MSRSKVGTGGRAGAGLWGSGQECHCLGHGRNMAISGAQPQQGVSTGQQGMGGSLRGS